MPSLGVPSIIPKYLACNFEFLNRRKEEWEEFYFIVLPFFPSPVITYSLRSATTGSTRDALAAGIKYPASAIAAKPRAEPMNTIGSVALT